MKSVRSACVCVVCVRSACVTECHCRSMGKAEREMLVVEVWDDDQEMAAPTSLRVKGLKQ